MKGKDISDALGNINENFVRGSAPKKRKHKKSAWIVAVAAVLAVAIGVGIVLRGGNPVAVKPVPGTVKAYAVAAPVYPASAAYPASELGDGFEKWADSRQERTQYRGAGKDLAPFMDRCAGAILGARQENTVFSPVSAYLAAAMLAEITDNETRAQLLSLLGAESVDAVRKTAESVWNANYSNDGALTSILGTSVWLGDTVNYNRDTLQTLADSYYAASFSGSFAKKDYVQAMRGWLNEQTGNLLKDAVDGVEISPDTVFALLSTVLFRAKWDDEFSKSETSSGAFHALSGDETADYMHATFTYGWYYWGEKFGAVKLDFKTGGEMWFFLPDEGVTPDELFSDPEALQLMDLAGDWKAQSEWENQKMLRINLSLPKFDVSSDLDLADTLKALGVTDCFDASRSDFTPLTADTAIAVSQVKHAARVTVDEEGVTATAFTAIIGAGAAMPPEDEMDFVLDRPFAFTIAGLDSLPLFEGTVFSIEH